MLQKKHVHDAPWLQVRDPAVFDRFCSAMNINPLASRNVIIDRICEAFKRIPYENLTKIIKADAVITTASAMRYPDELLNDYLLFGTGGTCFSLTAAVVAVLSACGIEVYPILADRYYGVDTHCGVMIVDQDGSLLLLDPGYLLFAPVKIPQDGVVSFNTGFNSIELKPVMAGTKAELYTIVKNNRNLRLTFRLQPVSDDVFAKAWEQSFAFEMMTYPILTRYANGCHQYLQGNVLAIRNAEQNKRMVLTPQKQVEFLESSVGIKRDIIIKALEIVDYGKNTAVPRS